MFNVDENEKKYVNIVSALVPFFNKMLHTKVSDFY